MFLAGTGRMGTTIVMSLSPPHAISYFRRTPWFDVFLFAVALGGGLWLVLGGGASGYDWQWYRLWRHVVVHTPHGWEAGPLLHGVGITLQVAGAGMGIALVLGLGVTLLRLSGSVVGHWLCALYVELVRNTPLLIQLFVAYFVFAPVLGMGRFATAVLALGIFEGAYMAEILRGGVAGIPNGQWEAARSLGLGTWGTCVEVVLPQAVRRVLPPLAGQGVSLVKDSSLASVIAIEELTMRTQVVAAETFLTFEAWFLAAAIYLVLTLAVSGCARLLERRFGYAF